jgi:hypothetical protein
LIKSSLSQLCFDKSILSALYRPFAPIKRGMTIARLPRMSAFLEHSSNGEEIRGADVDSTEESALFV